MRLFLGYDLVHKLLCGKGKTFSLAFKPYLLSSSLSAARNTKLLSVFFSFFRFFIFPFFLLAMN
jgi:hypothetical protein